jgi:hypothetical protein
MAPTHAAKVGALLPAARRSMIRGLTMRSMLRAATMLSMLRAATMLSMLRNPVGRSVMWLHATCATLTLALAVQPAGAQQRPDFSGEWTQARPDGRGRGGPRGDMGSGWGPALAITQNAATVTVQYDVFVRGDLQPPLRFSYALDGSETRNAVMMGRGIQERTSTATWQGDTLAITTVFDVDEPDVPEGARVELRRRLWLEGPAALVVEATRTGVRGGPTTTTRTVYAR